MENWILKCFRNKTRGCGILKCRLLQMNYNSTCRKAWEEEVPEVSSKTLAYLLFVLFIHKHILWFPPLHRFSEKVLSPQERKHLILKSKQISESLTIHCTSTFSAQVKNRESESK